MLRVAGTMDGVNGPLCCAWINKAHDPQVTDVFKFFFTNNDFKMKLLEAGRFSEVLLMDAVSDAWSAVALRGLDLEERALRAYRCEFVLSVVYGERLHVPGAGGINGCKDGIDKEYSGLLTNPMIAILSNTGQRAMMDHTLHLADELDLLDGRSYLNIDIESYFSHLVWANGFKPDARTAEGTLSTVDTKLLVRGDANTIHSEAESKKRKYAPDDTGACAYVQYNDGRCLDPLDKAFRNELARWHKRMTQEAKGKFRSVRSFFEIKTTTL